MNSQSLISFIIPTYNRAEKLKILLNCVISQSAEVKDSVEICISDDGSADGTAELVGKIQGKSPVLIKYRRNEKNLGFVRNILAAMKMAEGGFIWLFGDDNELVDGGLKKVVDFIKKQDKEKLGLLTVASKSYFIEEKDGGEMIYYQTVEKDKPTSYLMDKDIVISHSFPYSSFLPVLLLNNEFIQKTLKEEAVLVEEALKARDYIHVFLYQMMFLKYPQLRAFRLNEIIIGEEMPCYKFYIEDRFNSYYSINKKLKEILLSSGLSMGAFRGTILSIGEGSLKNFIFEMLLMRAFNVLNYNSFFGCVKMFFKKVGFAEALQLCVIFAVFLITPPFLLRNFYKLFIRIRIKNKWREIWFYKSVVYSKMSQGKRRFIA